METIRIDSDRMFRAVTATGYKLLAYNLDVRTGEVVSRTLSPEEVTAENLGPSVKPLPKMGGDLSRPTDFVAPSTATVSPFGPREPAPEKPKLFADDGPKKAAFDGDFWKRDEGNKKPIFNDGFKRENATKKLAALFGEAPSKRESALTPSKPAPRAAPKPSGEMAAPSATDDPYYPRVPAADDATMTEWMSTFAKQCGDPLIRDELLKALLTPKPHAAFERALRNHVRMGQQWERFLRKTALACAEVWLNSLNVEWEWKE